MTFALLVRKQKVRTVNAPARETIGEFERADKARGMRKVEETEFDVEER